MLKTIGFTKEMEEALLKSHCPEDCIPLLNTALKEKKLDLPDTDKKWLLGEALKYICEKYNDPLLVHDFVTHEKEDGSLRLDNYSRKVISVWFQVENLEQETVPDRKHISIHSNTYVRGSAPEVILPDIITEIRPFCFENCKEVRKIIIPDSIRIIPRGAFCNCEKLEEVVLPETVTVIREGAFIGCRNLKTIHLPAAVSEIGSCAFFGCENLTSVDLPASLKEVGYGVFSKCRKLTELRVPEGFAVPTEKHVFYGCPLPDLPALRNAPLPGDAEKILDELNYALDIYAAGFLNRTNCTYSFFTEEIAPPDPAHVESRVEKTEWEDDISGYLDIDVIAEEDFAFLKRIYADTLNHLHAEIFRGTKDAMQDYTDEYHCFFVLDMRFLRIGNRWYLSGIEWSD